MRYCGQAGWVTDRHGYRCTDTDPDSDTGKGGALGYNLASIPPTVGAVSKQDSQFINHFSLVLGVLVAIAIVLGALARSVAAKTQKVEIYDDPAYVANVEASTAAFAREAVACQDNSSMAIKAPAGAGPSIALTVPKTDKDLFENVCTSCHGAGIAGAPKAGDKSAWASRIAEGKATLYQHALSGFTGKAGVMPPKGGRTDLPDDLIKQGVDYMVSLAQ
jgi:cytochrome c5